MKYKVPFIRPSFPSSADITDDYEKIVQSNWYTNFGPYEQRFCHAAADFIGQDVHVSTAANATLALDLAVRALLSKDEGRHHVVVPSFTFATGPEVLLTHGYTPVFIDIDKKSWQPDIEQARVYLWENTDKVSGILLCNTFGVGSRHVEAWEKLALEYSVPLIIDSAAGFGSQYEADTYTGARGDCEIFSLHATKPFAVGEGGLVVSRSAQLITNVRRLQNFGFNDERDIVGIGTNAKLQELNCAIGLRQLEGFSERLQHRQGSLAYYKSKLTPVGYAFQENDDLSTVPFVSTTAPNKQAADEAYHTLLDNGIEVKRYYSPLHYQGIFEGKTITAASLAVTEDIYSRIISLPLHDGMESAIIDEITDIMKRPLS